jgi:hypothetical protein
MTEAKKSTAPTKPAKGGRKGGTLFPKISLKQALDYAEKLVSKTHTGPQPEKTILPGVFGNAGPIGRVRASALKQYGLLEGTIDAYKATKLAKNIEAAINGDRLQLLQHAFLNSKLFNQIFETFHGDTVSKAKIEQRAKGLDVHPESAGECAQLFIESALTASLGTMSGDSILLMKAGEIAPGIADDTGDEIDGQEKEDSGGVDAAEKASDGKNSTDTGSKTPASQASKPGVTLTLTVDPSSDPDKLEKQLKLLRQYGMI